MENFVLRWGNLLEIKGRFYYLLKYRLAISLIVSSCKCEKLLKLIFYSIFLFHSYLIILTNQNNPLKERPYFVLFPLLLSLSCPLHPDSYINSPFTELWSSIRTSACQDTGRGRQDARRVFSLRAYDRYIKHDGPRARLKTCSCENEQSSNKCDL